MRQVMALLACALALAGCATVTRGLSDQVQINTDPPGAEIKTSLGHQCVSPCSLTFQRKDEFVVTINKAGYLPEQIPVRTQIAGSGAAGFAGNIVVGGLVGMGVDAVTGATLEHCPNPIAVRLRPLNSRDPPNQGAAALCGRGPGI